MQWQHMELRNVHTLDDKAAPTLRTPAPPSLGLGLLPGAIRPTLGVQVLDLPVSYTHLRAHETGAYL
eukprot:5781966-Pyramimonas_sp.AAC.1